MASYATKRVFRSWKLFLALLLGVILASAFFSGISIGSDSVARQALNQLLANAPVDLELSYYGRESTLLSSNLTHGASLALSVGGVTGAEVNSLLYSTVQVPSINVSFFAMCSGLFVGSRVYNGITGWTGSLGINETLVSADSTLSSRVHIGDVIVLNMTQGGYFDDNYIDLALSVRLTVVGLVTLTDEAFQIATLGNGGYFPTPFGGTPQIIGETASSQRESLCLVGWDTISRLIDASAASGYGGPLQARVSVFLDRAILLDPWDIAKSLEAVSRVSSQISNKVVPLGFSAYDRLSDTLRSFQNTANNLRFSTIITALPIFFVAWYMASTVSNVSFNLRRREIGLLLSKGSTKWQLMRIFMSEAFLIGAAGGVMGVGLSYALSPLFAQLGGEISGPRVVLGMDTLLMTVFFAVAITIVSIFQPARKATAMDPVGAMREYVYVEEVRPYRRLLPMVAFVLGTFKIVILLLGVNIQQSMMSLATGSNMFLSIMLGILYLLDSVLNYIGPLLFFWGVTKVFIQGSVLFQKLSTWLMRGILGDLGSLATRNIQRNPGRTASIAFLIALIIGYTISVNGALASEQDYTKRQIYYNVGSYQVHIDPSSATAVPESVARVENISGVSFTSVEYGFYGESTSGYVTLKAVDATEWPDLGYYEEEWFIGETSKNAFLRLAEDNESIILDRGLGKYLGLELGDRIVLWFGDESSVYDLKLVGFYGSEQSPQQYYYPLRDAGGLSYSGYYSSYVSEEFYRMVSGKVYSSPRILVALKPGTDGHRVVEEIRGLDPSVGTVAYVDEIVETQQNSAELTGVINIQRLGIAFAVVAASIGTCLVTIVSLSERRKEISLISVRGASYRQLLLILLSETFPVVVFALLLGSTVGFIILRGNVMSTNVSIIALVKKRIILSTGFLSMLSSGYILIFTSLMIPVFLVSRRYMSRLGDAIRQR